MTPVETVLAKLDRVRRNGEGWQARCPAHDDREPSLSIGEGDDGRALLSCHAGCDLDAILDVLGLATVDLFPKPTTNGARVVATYAYTDETGALLFEKVRYSPKRFAQRRPDGDGGYAWKLDGVRRVPYRLPELLEGVGAGRWVLVVEGEKAVERLVREGFVATCGSGGAGKWRSEYGEHFTGAKVAVLVDNDEPGRAHGEQVARALSPVAECVKVLALSGLPDKGDVVDCSRVAAPRRSCATSSAPRPSGPKPPLSRLAKGLLHRRTAVRSSTTSPRSLAVMWRARLLGVMRARCGSHIRTRSRPRIAHRDSCCCRPSRSRERLDFSRCSSCWCARRCSR